MDEESRQELFETQTAEQFEQIGRFVVEFEQACWWLRIGIVFALQRDGLRTQSLAQILTDNKFMTANPLIETYDAIVTQTGVRDDPIQKEVLDQASKEFRALISERNKIVHGLWFIGYASVDDQDFSKIAGTKGNPSKQLGMSFQDLPANVDDIKCLVERAKKLGNLLMVIDSLLAFQTTEQDKRVFERYLAKEGDTWTIRTSNGSREDVGTSHA